jgi:hypothetical protein
VQSLFHPDYEALISSAWDGHGELPSAPRAAAELAEDPPVLELGVCPFTGCAELRVGVVCFFLRFRFVLSPVRDLRVRAALVALVGQRDQAGGLEFGEDAPDPLGFFVVDRAGQRAGDPEDVPVGLAMTCRFIPRRLCLPE